MKRYAKIATACLMIVALMVDSVTACWFFARRMRCRPCVPTCYARPVVYGGCGLPAGMTPMETEWQSYPPSDVSGGIEIPPPPTTVVPDRSSVPPIDRAAPPPPERSLEPSPSDRGVDGIPDTAPDRGQPPVEQEPMPEPPADAAQPGPNPFENPFRQPPANQPDAALPPANQPDTTLPPANQPDETLPADERAAPPTPGGTELDNPFGPRPGETETMPPAETTPAPMDDTTEGAPPATDNPFAPRDATPPAPADADNPFAPRSGANDGAGTTAPASAEPTASDLFAPRAADAQPPADNPFAPPPAAAGSTPDDPFRLPSDAGQPPMSEVNEAPMNTSPAPMRDTTDGASGDPPPAAEQMPESAFDNPFAPPEPARRSANIETREPADGMRVWTDITGKHQVRGQMKRILLAERKVRILKDTGKYTTVPFAKLSEADRTFVASYAIRPSALLAETR